MDRDSRRVSLKWKIGGMFAALALASGALIIAAGVPFVRSAARGQIDARLTTIATNLSDGSAGHIMGKNLLALNALLRKYTLLNGVAYAYVQDAKGEVVAHTFASFPEELRPRSVAGGTPDRRAARSLSFSGSAVYESNVPVLEGQAGTVVIGFWQDAIEGEISRAAYPLIVTVTIVSAAAAVFALLLAQWIVRPIAGLLAVADKVTMGDLETAVSGQCVQSRDEIGELARSLERMRSSLKAAMLRLGRETA